MCRKKAIMKKISIYNNKGGVAKTTSVINIAYAMHKADKKILVVDCDTQENCYSFFLTSKNAAKVLPTDYENISHTTWDAYSKLDEDELNSYDFILFDLPPAMTDEVKEIIKQSDKVYVPTILGEFEIAGLRKVTDEVGSKLGGIFVTMYQKDNDREIIEQFRSLLQDRLLQTTIPYSKTVRESQKKGLPIEEYFIERGVPRIFKNSWNIVNAYEALTKEIMGGEA